MSLFNHMIKKNFSIPLYYQLKEAILQEIDAGNYNEHTPLPPETEIAERFKISRPTVRQAINALANSGIVRRTKGKGTYVIPPDIKEETIHHLNHNPKEPSSYAKLQPIDVISLNKVTASPDIAQCLNITIGSAVFELSRLTYSADLPNALIESYIPSEICPSLTEHDFRAVTLREAFEQNKIFIKHVKRIFSVGMPSSNECKKLHISATTPLFISTSIVYAAENYPIEYSITKYRGDKNKFALELKK